MMKKRK